jgi:hypothetical protein
MDLDDDDIDPLLKQLPKSVPPPPNLEMSELPEDVYYPDGPPVIIPVQLDKKKYNSRQEALVRARELCTLRNLKFIRMFETARYYVAQCCRAQEIGP